MISECQIIKNWYDYDIRVLDYLKFGWLCYQIARSLEIKMVMLLTT